MPWLFPSGCWKEKFNSLIIFTSKDEISVIEDEQGSKRQNVASEKDSPVGVAQADDESNKDVSKLLSLDAFIWDICTCSHPALWWPRTA